MIKSPSPSPTIAAEATPNVPDHNAVPELIAKKKKNRKKKKKKAVTAVLVDAGVPQNSPEAEPKTHQLHEFLNEAMDKKACVVLDDYFKLYLKYRSDLFQTPIARSKTIVDILSILQEKKASLEEDIKRMNVLHAILCGMDSHNETSAISDLILYLLWHRMLAVYDEFTRIYSTANTSILAEIYKEAILDSSMLIEHYRPKFVSYIKLLEQEEHKETATKLYELTNVGLWDSFKSTLNIDYFHSVFLFNIGRIDEASKLDDRLESNIKVVDESTVRSIMQNDPSNAYSKMDLKRIEENLRSVVNLCLAVNIEKFFREIVSISLPVSQDILSDLLKKYDYIFNDKRIIATLASVIKRCDHILSVGKIQTTQQIKEIQDCIHVVQFLYQEVLPQHPKLTLQKDELLYKLVELINKSMSDIYDELIESKNPELVGHYVEYCTFLEKNYNAYSQIQPAFNLLIILLLKNKESQYKKLTQSLLKMCFFQIVIETKQACFCYALSDKNKVKSALQRRQKTLEFARTHLKNLSSRSGTPFRDATNSLLIYESVQKKLFEETSKTSQVQTDLEFIIASVDDIMHCSSSSVNLQQSKQNAAQLDVLIPLVLSSFFAPDFNSKIKSFLNLTFTKMPSLTRKYEIHLDSVNFLKNASKLCKNWVSIYKKRDAKCNYFGYEKFHYHLVIEKLEQLSLLYAQKADAILAQIDKLPASNVLKVVQTGTLAPQSEEYHLLFARFKESYFQDEVQTQKTVDDIVQFVENSEHISPLARLNIIHFLLQSLSKELIAKNPHLYVILWTDLGECCTAAFYIWGQNIPEIGKCHEFNETIMLFISLYTHYKVPYQTLLNRVLAGDKPSPEFMSRLKGNLFYHLIYFLQIEASYTNLSFIIGNTALAEEQLEEINQAFSDLKQSIPKIICVDGELSEIQVKTLSHLDDGLIALNKEEQFFEPDSDPGTIYQYLLNFGKNLEAILEKAIQPLKPSNEEQTQTLPTPLMLLESLLSDSSIPSLINCQTLTLAFELMGKSQNRYEDALFLQTFIDLCIHWGTNIRSNNPIIANKMIVENLESFSRMCSVTLQFVPQCQLTQDIQLEELEKFIQKSSSLAAGQCDALYPELFEEYKKILFENRSVTYLTINSLMSHMKKSTDNQSNVNICHFLISHVIEMPGDEYGSMHSIMTQLLIIFWENHYKAFVSLKERLVSKTVQKGEYHRAFANVERHMLILNRYSPLINSLLSKWIREINISNEQIKARTLYLFETLFHFQNQYSNIQILQWNIISAKSAWAMAQKVLDELEKVISDRSITLRESQNKLTHAFQRPVDGSFKLMQVVGKLLNKLTRIESEYVAVLEALTTPAAAQVNVSRNNTLIPNLDLLKPNRSKKYSGFTQLLSTFYKIQETAVRFDAINNLEKFITLLENYKEEFISIKDLMLNDSFIVELFCEKCDAIIAECRKVVPKVVLSTVKERESPKNSDVFHFTRKFEKMSLGRAVQPKTSSIVNEPFVLMAPLKPEIEIDPDSSKLIDNLIDEAQSISAIDLDNTQKSEFLEENYGLFNEEHIIIETIARAFKHVETLSTHKDL